MLMTSYVVSTYKRIGTLMTAFMTVQLWTVTAVQSESTEPIQGWGITGAVGNNILIGGSFDTYYVYHTGEYMLVRNSFDTDHLFHTGESVHVRNSFDTYHVYQTGESSRVVSPFYDHHVYHAGKSSRVIPAAHLTQVRTHLFFVCLCLSKYRDFTSHTRLDKGSLAVLENIEIRCYAVGIWISSHIFLPCLNCRHQYLRAIHVPGRAACSWIRGIHGDCSASFGRSHRLLHSLHRC